MEPQLNTHLGGYLLDEVIGRSAMAVVYRARQVSLQRTVAVKVLLRNLEPRYVSRFEREAQAIAQLQHRNILPIYDYGIEEPWHYFVMQYVENSRTLAQNIAGGPLAVVPALRLVIILLNALAYAHGRGIVHRDIKPANILMPWPDWPLLADFGIAKLLSAPQQLTPPGHTVGTAAYMAPEMGLAGAIDARADLYSTGVVLYEMLTGRLPFTAATPIAMLKKHMEATPRSPRAIRPELPVAVEAVVLRALEKDPDDRYQSATEMAEALEQAARQVQLSQAQHWLRGQLGAAIAASARRSGYTTGKLWRRPGYTTRKLSWRPGHTTYRMSKLSPPAAVPQSLPKPIQPPAYPAPAQATAPDARQSGNRADPALARANRKPSQPRPPGEPELGLLLGLILLLVFAIGTVILWPGTGAVAEAPLQETATAAAASPTAAEQAANPLPPATAVPTQQPALPTAEPAEQASPVVPDVAAVATPTLDVSEPPFVVPTNPPPPPLELTAPPIQSIERDGLTVLRLEDTNWSGGYNRSRGSNSYGGRSAIWIYGASTEYSTMTTSFELAEQPSGEAELLIEGMDSEGDARTPISISINGTEIYNGPNPLPDDDLPYDTGTWATESWRFDAALLRAGRNEIRISNLAAGGFGRPPFFMLDYAELIP